MNGKTDMNLCFLSIYTERYVRWTFIWNKPDAIHKILKYCSIPTLFLPIVLKHVNTQWANGWTLFTLSLYSAHRTHILPLCPDTLTQINRHRFQHQRYSILYIFPSVETKHILTVFLFPESQQNRGFWRMETFKNSCGDRCCPGGDNFTSFVCIKV